MKTFPELCSHPNKYVICPDHEWSCPDCGFGIGQAPRCCCNEPRELPKSEPVFGTHIREAIQMCKSWSR